VTWEIAFLFLVLAAMVYLFMTEKIPVELTAFLGLLVLVFTRYVPVAEAFTGFSSPAVMTMFSIFFISGALLQTGVADAVGGRLHALAGGREVPLIALVMTVTGVLSAFMFNVAAAAVMLPVIASLARRSGVAPSRLFMPLAFGAILGGTTTLIGTPPNILAAEALAEHGHEPFGLFDFTPIGLALLVAGVVFMLTLGRRLLPRRAADMQARASTLLSRAYRLEERLTSIAIPAGSGLDGRSLRDARLGTTLDVKVVAVERGGRRHLAPPPDFALRGGDHLLVEGRFDDLSELLRVQGIAVAEMEPGRLSAVSARIRGVVLRPTEGSGIVGRTLAELRFRHRFGAMVVGIRRDGDLLRQRLANRVLRASDEILALCGEEQLPHLRDQKAFVVEGSDVPGPELLAERLYVLRIPETSPLAGRSMAASRIGELVGLTVVGILRDQAALLAVEPEEEIRAGDQLLVAGEPTRLIALLELGDLHLEDGVPRRAIESEEVGVTEAVVAPRSSAAGATARELEFRGRYGLQVLALWRAGTLLHRELADVRLRFGDALLLHGPREKIYHLGRDGDFIVLTETGETPRRRDKAPVALAALGLMILLVAAGFYPIHIAAFAGAVVSVLFGALKMEEAYRLIEWRVLFLVAAILPVGVAMEASGAAAFLAEAVVALAGRFGPWALLAALAALSSLLSQALDGAPTVVILAPVVIVAAEQLAMSPYPLMMVVGLAASAAFMTPFSQKVGLLVMSAGGYRTLDYVRVGTPLTLLFLALVVILVPIFFPLTVP
jgi:di/tricarboxylate transporter